MAHPDYRKTFGLETVPIRIVAAHAPLDQIGGQDPEFIDIVVSTASMDRSDWIRARVFAYVVDLLLYDRILHVPLVLLSAGSRLGLRRVFEGFMDADSARFPVTAAVSRTFADHARAISAGGPQYIPSTEWLNLWWPADQHALINLAHAEALDAFYNEAQVLLTEIAQVCGSGLPPELIADAVHLNRAMLALPFQLEDEVVETTYPVAEDYHAVIAGDRPRLRKRPSKYRIERSGTIWMSWADWCEDLVRRVYLRKYYLYPVHPASGSVGSPRRVTSRAGPV
jgi:hypothetical protein